MVKDNKVKKFPTKKAEDETETDDVVVREKIDKLLEEKKPKTVAKKKEVKTSKPEVKPKTKAATAKKPTKQKAEEKPKAKSEIKEKPKVEKKAKAKTEPVAEKEKPKKVKAAKKGEEEELPEEAVEEYKVKKKPKFTKEQKEKLKLRKQIKKRTPEFLREEWFRYKRIPKNWRRPDGITSKMRINLKYRPSKVRVGFRGPKEVRGLHASGFEEVIVHNVDDLEAIDPNKQAARIGSTVGTKKRMDIEKKAEELDVRILNL
jgi:large subunit ribosomal protein L32e